MPAPLTFQKIPCELPLLKFTRNFFSWTKSLDDSLKLLLCIHKVVRCVLTIRCWPADCYKLHSFISNRLIQFPHALHMTQFLLNNIFPMIYPLSIGKFPYWIHHLVINPVYQQADHIYRYYADKKMSNNYR